MGKVIVILLSLGATLISSSCRDMSAPRSFGNVQGRVISEKMVGWTYQSEGNQAVGMRCKWFVKGPKIGKMNKRGTVKQGKTDRRNRFQSMTFYSSDVGGLIYSDQCKLWKRSDQIR